MQQIQMSICGIYRLCEVLPGYVKEYVEYAQINWKIQILTRYEISWSHERIFVQRETENWQREEEDREKISIEFGALFVEFQRREL